MMKTRGIAGAWVAIGLMTLAARADETAIPLDQLPKAVADAAKAKFPGARWREAARETEDGKTVFEVALTQDGRRSDVTFRPDGTLEVVETEVPESDLPDAAARAVKAKYPGAKINLVESVKKGPELKRDVDYFELHLTTADKTSVEIEVDAQGKILKTETAADADDPGKG